MSDSMLSALTNKQPTRFQVTEQDFKAFRASYIDPRAGATEEKYLEYFVAWSLFRFQPGDIYIDIASQDCPFNQFIGQKFGIEAFRQDLYYLANSKDAYDVSGDACSLPFPDNYFTHMSLFNSFEHFEDDRDTAFIIEAQRVLRPGGRLLLMPLEIGLEYSIETDAGYVDAQGVKHLWGVGARYARTYDVAAFRTRVIEPARQLSPELYEIEDQWPRAADCYARWFMMFRKTA